MEFHRLKDKFLLVVALVLGYMSQAQESYRLFDEDSFPHLRNKGNVSAFCQKFDIDTTSLLQILFIQLDNDNLAESYYIKIDSNYNIYKAVFRKNLIVKEHADTFCCYQKIDFLKKPSNDKKGVYYYEVATDGTAPTFLAVKKGNAFSKWFFYDVNIEKALKEVKELKQLRDVFDFLKTQTSIKFYKALDG